MLKVISPNGARRVAKTVFAERGKNITFVLGTSVTTVYEPLILTFAQKCKDIQLVERAPPGSATIYNNNDWMISESFLLYIKRFWA